MLTTKQVRARVRGSEIHPTFIDTGRKDLVQMAEAFCGIVHAAHEESWTRGELTDALRDQIGNHRSTKILQGLAKLLEDGCRFDVDASISPIDLRRLVFTRARERRPIALEANAFGWATADEVLDEVAAELELDPLVVRRTLYGDLKEAQVLVEAKVPDPAGLLARYNVALVQGLLLRASAVQLELHAPSVPRLRQLLRHAKFHQLIQHGEREGDIVRLTFDGPTSVLKQSTRYGLSLAKFFPAILLQSCNWMLTAEVLWTKARHRKTLTLNHEAPLTSHYRDTGAYFTREHQWFVDRWEALGNETWTMSEDTMPVELGGRGMLLPDFVFRDGEREAMLEIVGFWRRGYLERRLEAIRRFGPGNLVLAVSKSLGAEAHALTELGAEVVVFGKILPAKKVLEAIERVAR